MAEIHYFDIEVAKRYGVHCAVLLQNIWHWVKKNEANDKNFHDGYYWTYNSTKAFQELFPYLSQKQIETALKKLREEEIIITGNYNAVAYDRTLWYAITEKGKTILLAGEMDFTCGGNGNDNEGKPIPNIKPKSKTPNKKKERNYNEIINEMISDEELKKLIYGFIQMRNLKKKPLTDLALTRRIEELFRLSKDIEDQKEIVGNSIDSCWDKFYPLKKEAENVQANNRADGSEYAFLG